MYVRVRNRVIVRVRVRVRVWDRTSLFQMGLQYSPVQVLLAQAIYLAIEL
jgi:hypothetical protein